MLKKHWRIFVAFMMDDYVRALNSSARSLRRAIERAGDLLFFAMRRNIVLGVCTLLMFVWAFKDFFGTGMLAYGDQAPFPQTAQQAFDAFFSSWHPISLGSTAQYPLSFLLGGITIALAAGNAILAQKIWLFVPMPLSFASMYIFSRRFSGSSYVRWISSFVYSVNPMTIGPPYIGGATGMLFYYAFLPLQFELLIQLFGSSRNSVRNSLLFSLLFTVSGGLIAAFYLLPLFASLLAYVLVRRKIRFALSRLAFLGCSFFLFFGLTLPFTYSNPPVFARYLPSSLNAGQPPILLSDLIAGIAYTYGQQTAENLLNFGATALPFAGYSSSVAWWGVLGLTYPMLAFFSLLFVRRDRNAKFIAWFSTYSLATLTFIGLTKLGPGLAVFRAFPFLFTFSNPSGLLLMVMLGYAPLIAITLDRILVKYRQKIVATASARNYRIAVRTGTLVAAACLLVLMSSYVWPFFTGSMGFNTVGVPTSRLTIPAVYYDASKWIQQHSSSNDSFRTLWVPLDYQAQLDVRWLDLSALTFPLGIGQYLTFPITRYVGFVFSALARNQTTRIGSLLGPLNVKYVVVNLESSQSGPPTSTGFLNYGEPFLFGSPRAYASILSSQKDLTLVENATTFLVYSNLAFEPRVDVFDKMRYVGSLGSKDEYASNLEALQFLSHFPGYDASRQMLILGGSLPLAQRPWFMEKSDTIVMNVDDSGTVPSYGTRASQGTFQIIRSQPTLGIWTPVSGEWAIQGGKLIGTSPDMPSTWSYADIFYDRYSLSDFKIETQFYIYSPVADSAYQQPGIFLRQTAEGFYLVEVEPNANRIAVYRSDLSEPLAISPVHIQPNAWYNLTATISGPAGNVHLSVLLNETPLVDVQDTNSPNSVLRGHVGLRSKGYHTSIVAFEDTEISTLDGRVLYHSVPWPYTIVEAEVGIPRADNYSVLAYAPGTGSVKFSLGTTTINSSRIEDGWYKSPSIHFEQGTYNLTINYGNRTLSQADILQTHIAVVSSNFPNSTVVSESQPVWSFQHVSSTKYVVTIESEGPAFIQLGEMYAPEWTAVINGLEKAHFVASSFLNGFYIETGGVYHIVIDYQVQSVKSLATIISTATWVFILASLLYVVRRPLRLRLKPR